MMFLNREELWDKGLSYNVDEVIHLREVIKYLNGKRDKITHVVEYELGRWDDLHLIFGRDLHSRCKENFYYCIMTHKFYEWSEVEVTDEKEIANLTKIIIENVIKVWTGE